MPAMKNGIPVTATAIVEVSDRPVLIRAPYPSLSRLDEKHGTVTVSFDVSREGSAENLRVEKSRFKLKRRRVPQMTLSISSVV